MKLAIFGFLFLLLGLAQASNFNRDFEITWGQGNAKVLDNGTLVTLSLDRITGSGFESKNEFLYGKFDIQIKLVPGNSAGTVATVYFSSLGAHHDEIDLEFLGNLTGQPYTLNTNVFTQGRGGREQQFNLWFDPTKDFHTYSILWNPRMIKFTVDGIPVRQYKNLESMGIPYPLKQPMRIYSSIWNADSWATRGGLVKTNWSHAPFTASFKNINTMSCSAIKSSDCSSTNSWFSEVLDSSEEERLKWVKKKYMVYDYCTDRKRFIRGFPGECTMA